MSRVSKIELKTGEIALVDMADAHLVREYRWHRGGTKNGYACAYARTGRGRRKLYLHRLVMGAGDGQTVDHINGDPLDCRKENLRIVTRSQNAANRSKTRNPSGFRGVFYFPKKRKFQARLTCQGKVYRGPYQEDAESAAHDWDGFARGFFGEYASLNFPRQGERGVVAVGEASRDANQP